MCKKVISLVIILSVLLLTVGCGCEHEWIDATCIAPKTCSLCGQKDGDALGHKFSDADCINPKICTVCNMTEGEALGHDWSEATADKPMTCNICGETNGKALSPNEAYGGNVIAEGTEENGDHYQLVAKETETYAGVQLELGVIKNNSWLLEPTTQMPMIDDDGTIYGKYCESIYDEKVKVKYIGNSCFSCENLKGSVIYDSDVIIYNSDTGKYHQTTLDCERICISYDCMSPGLTPDRGNFSKYHKVSKNNSLLITGIINYSNGPEMEILDTNTMVTRIFRLEETSSKIGTLYPISEEIFAIGDSKINFYDKDGKKILKNDYRLKTRNQLICFENGKCTFDIINSNDTPYRITIDKSGNVLSSVELSE